MPTKAVDMLRQRERDTHTQGTSMTDSAYLATCPAGRPEAAERYSWTKIPSGSGGAPGLLTRFTRISGGRVPPAGDKER
ncbi:MAG: hypothetical protein ACLS43_01425 [Evtepia gabavorous]